MSGEWGPGTSTGCGHVWPRPDGKVARCGGPDMCRSCMADAATLAERVGAKRVPTLRWERNAEWWTALSGTEAVAFTREEWGDFPWTLAPGAGADVTGVAGTLDAAKAAAEAAWGRWCERAGLVPREGFVPPYKGDAAGPRTAEGNGAEPDTRGGR